MLINEIIENEPILEKQVWARSGKKIVRKYRCSSGRRAGKTVSKMSQCFAPVNPKKRQTLRRTMAKFGARMARKSRRTKRMNPVSIRVQRMNRR